MDSTQFSKFRHEAVHELMSLNEACEKEFHIGSWSRWDYDLERQTLTFSQEGLPRVEGINSGGWNHFHFWWNMAMGLGK